MSSNLMNIMLGDTEVEIEYEYTPEEQAGMQGPGQDEDVEILSARVVYAQGKFHTDIMDFFKDKVWEVLDQEDSERGMEMAEALVGGER